MRAGSWVAGEVVTAALLNTHLRDNLSELRTGGLALSSQAALDFLYASSASQFARLAASASKAPRLNAAGSAWEMALFNCELLKANSGTTTNAAAENVDTYAMASGLTAKDTVVAFISMSSDTQQTATPSVYNSTDSVQMAYLVGTNQAAPGSIAAGAAVQTLVIIRQAQNGATTVHSHAMGRTLGGNFAIEGGGVVSTFTTNWTGAWTLALRHGGVTAGGTGRWSWTVCKVNGQ